MTMSSMILTVNGRFHTVQADESTPLVYVLRNELGLTGTKLGCALEQCGACAVLVDGKSVLSCNAPVGQFAGREVQTVEATDDALLQEVKNEFVGAGAAQCGYCIPGLVIAVAGLLKQNRHPGETEIRAALRPHLCRCGTHVRVLAAARALAGRKAGP
jgi:nicotinate dehydrogenase subunit A